MTPLLKLFLVLSYVVLAAFVGALHADSRPKGRVMFMTNTIKVLGCMTMLIGAHPLLAYGIVGFGAAAYSPAKYGILTELLPPERLVAANGWIEGTTVGSIILGTVMGGALIAPNIAHYTLRYSLPFVHTAAQAAMVIIMVVYVIAALFNLGIPDTGARYPQQQHDPIRLITDFADCFTALWNDKLGQISLAVTTLFWGAGATLQFIVLKWAEYSLENESVARRDPASRGGGRGCRRRDDRRGTRALEALAIRAAGGHRDGGKRDGDGVLRALAVSPRFRCAYGPHVPARLFDRRVFVLDVRRCSCPVILSCR